ncbi:RNA-guided endonuclease InsQ/TnpB family protein, partial [Ligilactobacillus murinus]
KVHKAGTPNYHKKSYRQSYQTNCQYGKNKSMDMFSGSVRFIDKKHIQMPKLGKLRVSGSYRRILDKKSDIRIGTVTISKDSADRYFVSMQLGSDTPFVKILPKTNSQIGIDLNTENFLTTSDGVIVDNPRYYRTIKHKLAKAQRTLSRRELRAKKENRSLRDSKNYQKQRHLVAKLHDKIRNQRKNFLNYLSMVLINNHDLIVAENLRSSNLLKNHALAMSISDVGWRSFLQKLEYKANLYGRIFITVNPKNTTQMCHTCKFVMGTDDTQKLTLKDRQWI